MTLFLQFKSEHKTHLPTRLYWILYNNLNVIVTQLWINCSAKSQLWLNCVSIATQFQLNCDSIYWPLLVRHNICNEHSPPVFLIGIKLDVWENFIYFSPTLMMIASFLSVAKSTSISASKWVSCTIVTQIAMSWVKNILRNYHVSCWCLLGTFNNKVW